MPKRVVIERHNDGYRLELELLPDTVEINTDLPEKVFDLDNTEHLPDLDLDAPRKAEPPSGGDALSSNKNRNGSQKRKP